MPVTLPLTRIALGLLIACGVLVQAASGQEGAAVLQQARAALAAGEARRAVDLLEVGLIAADAAGRKAIREELRGAYIVAAKEAEAAGDTTAVQGYREHLAILDRARPAPASSATPPPPSAAAPAKAPATIDPAVERTAAPPPRAEPAPAPPAAPDPVPRSVPTPTPPPSKADDLPAADTAFRAQDYETAGRIYAALAEAKALPPTRNDHWAYCRCVAVVRRINAGPKPAEWQSIHDEIATIRQLSPRNWFGEYLRDLASQRSGAPPAPRPSAYIVRGADPDDGSTSEAADAPPPRDPIDQGASKPDQGLGRWKVLATANFRILHDDEALAARIAEVAEGLRDELFRRWAGQPSTAVWSPPCDIYLYPTEAAYRERTGQPAGSPGFTTIGLEDDRVAARRVNLHVDQPGLVESVLPHELTHVVLADLFGGTQAPRWADEGAAILAESPGEAATRGSVLAKALEAGELFRIATLMSADYPDGRHWELFCAQSASLARFLVERGSPAQFVEFARASAGPQLAPELRRIYGMDGVESLEQAWLSWTRAGSH